MSRNPNPYTMTTIEAAILFRVGRRTIVEYCYRGQLDAIKVPTHVGTDVWMINPDGPLKRKAEPIYGVWCARCQDFFIANEEKKCPVCGDIARDYDPVEIEPE